MGQPLREIKEAIFTIHNQTMLLLLENNIRKTHSRNFTLHLSIDYMPDNTITIDLHLAITRKPIYRDDHWQLYHSSVSDIVNSCIPTKKRLRLTDSWSFLDCGIDPQDVPRLLICTAQALTCHLWICGPNQSGQYGNWALLTRITWTNKMRMAEEDIQQHQLTICSPCVYSYNICTYYDYIIKTKSEN